MGMKYLNDLEVEGVAIQLRLRVSRLSDRRDYFATAGMQIAGLVQEANRRPWWIWQDK